MSIPVVESNEGELGEKDEILFLNKYQRFSNIPFACLQWMARLGVIPKRLRKCDTPLYSA